ncbi:NAD-dependent epimerase/dehydratase family protein [Aquipuribacter sp. SD81]|uniref:NAD-dependent epimerase/dehydratase family protein n=1 Tax=Aquipuribacter sp. SD81 TaxID=3127703 RepID=UPI003016E73D
MSGLVRMVVTGSSGFIGSRLVARALRRGDHVVALDRRPAPAEVLAAAAGAPGVLVPLAVDLADVADPVTAALPDVCGGADAVVHCAARSGVRARAGADLVALEAARARDILGTAQAVLAATAPDVPIVVMSSSAVYGGCLDAAGRRAPSRETDQVRPLGSYAGWKVRVEQACARRAAAGGAVVVARPFTVVGEGQRPDMAVAAWLAAARAGRPLRVLGGLERTRDLTDVDVVVAGLLAALDRGAPGVVNLGSGRPRRLAEVVEAVAGAAATAGWDAPRVVVERAAPEEVPASWAATGRLRALGVDPTTDLEAVVARQLRHLLAQAPAGADDTVPDRATVAA